MSKMKKQAMLSALGIMGAMMLPENEREALMNFDPKEKPILYLPPREYQPTGTKAYFFNSSGEFSTTKMLRTECIFKCYAINDKNAKRKFAKWQKSNCT